MHKNPLACRSSNTAKTPCRKEEVNDREDDSWYRAEFKGMSDDAENV